MTDEAPRRQVAFIAHSLLNQNAKVDEGAKTPAMWAPVIALLRERGYVIRHMPCPELAFGGARRFWGVREQFEAELAARGLRFPRATGIRHWHPDYDPQEERRRLVALLDGKE